MNEFVQLWVYLSSTPLFGLTATLAVYLLAQALYVRAGQAAWANPVLWSVVALAAGLTATGTAYPTYFSGAQFIHFLLGPAVVALAWPLWQRRAALRAHGARFVIAALAGGTAAAVSAVTLAWALGLPADVMLSLAPKSVTSPVAMGIAEKIGGIPSLTAVLVAATGIIGAASARSLFNAMRISDPTVRGFALGTAAHGIGTARAFQVSETMGAFAGLAMGLSALFSAAALPTVVSVLLRWL